MEGWANADKYQRDNGVEPCENKRYSHRSILKHVVNKSKECMYHYAISHYQSSLYFNGNDKLRKCVSNDVALPEPNQQYVKLMNW